MKKVCVGSLLSLVLAVAGARAGLEMRVTETPEAMRAYAAGGDAMSACNYAFSLLHGRGEKRDPAQALEWFKKSAAAGYAPAQLALGGIFLKGEVAPRDEKEAVKWLAAAGKQGLFEAQRAMVQFYNAGIGVEKSAEKALLWDALARRTLELHFEQPAGAPHEPARLRADGFAEYSTPAGPEALGPDGTLERVAADGTRTLLHPDGGLTRFPSGGESVTTYPDGRTVTDFPDGRKMTRDRKGLIETKFPDGTREVEGPGETTAGRAVQVRERFAADGRRLSQRIADGTWITEELEDGVRLVERTGEDADGRKVRVLDRVEKNGAPGPRRLVRADGVERTGDERWVIVLWLRQKDGKEVRVRWTFGRDNALVDETVLSVPVAPVAALPPAKKPPEKKPDGLMETHHIAEIMQPERPEPRQPVPIPLGRIGSPAGGVERSAGPARVLATLPPRPKTSIEPQLAELAKLEREGRYFAGATAEQYEKAAAYAKSYVFELPQPPQKPAAATRLVLRGSPPPLPAFTRLATDRSDQHPLGMFGRTALKLHPWQHTETEHFVVHYTDPKEAYSVMGDIECTFINVNNVLQLDPAAPRPKSHVFIFPTAAAWKAFKEPLGLDERVAGFAYKAELYLGAREQREQYLRTLCHEAAHAVVARYYPAQKWPLWLNEGLAEYLSAKQGELARSEKHEKPAARPPPWIVEVGRVVYREEYGFGGASVNFSDGRAVDGTTLFYLEAERCVRALLELLPPRSFPRFANLACAGNPLAVSLRGAYGEPCDTVEKWQGFINRP